MNTTSRLVASISLGLFFGVASVGMVPAFITSHQVEPRVVAILLGVASGFFSLLGLRAARDTWRERHEQIHLCERGLVFVAPKVTVERPWSDFVGAGITSVRQYGVEKSRLLEVAFTDGTRRVLTSLSEQAALFEAVVRHVPPLSFDPRAILPRSDGALDDDRVVSALGKRLSSHRHEGTPALLAFALLGLVLMGGGFGAISCALALNEGRGTWVGAVATGLVSLGAIIFSARRAIGHVRRKHEVVHAHERGLVFQRGQGRVDVIDWSEIRSAKRYNAELTLKLNSGKTELLIGVQAHTFLFGLIESRVAALGKR